MKEAPKNVILIGAGIMSATLGMLLKELNPNVRIKVFERLDLAASESSDAWNNAGTGHSAFCEMNYTPEKQDGTVEIDKALKVAESFEISRQFWSFLVDQGVLQNPDEFIRSIPHMSFVTGDKNVEFLKKRHEAMTKSALFEGMEFSDQSAHIAEWIPMMMEGRDPSEKIAATRMNAGTDVNFGSLTRSVFAKLQEMEGVEMNFHQEVKSMHRLSDGGWKLMIKNLATHEKTVHEADFVFIGAGGGSLTLLLKSKIPEGKTFGGFPVSGQWLRCTNPDVISRHHAKVYGKAAKGTPPMSVPHLDTRVINGEQALLFGPYAGFSTKFLKEGSLWDLFLSLRWKNIKPMIFAGLRNIPLTRYLVHQVTQNEDERIAALREFLPNVKKEDWALEVAGQRVQVIKKDEDQGGILEFGTEVVSASDGSLAALLGASPGASTAVSIMLNVLEVCFREEMDSNWRNLVKKMIPTYGQSLATNPELCRETRERTRVALKL